MKIWVGSWKENKNNIQRGFTRTRIHFNIFFLSLSLTFTHRWTSIIFKQFLKYLHKISIALSFCNNESYVWLYVCVFERARACEIFPTPFEVKKLQLFACTEEDIHSCCFLPESRENQRKCDQENNLSNNGRFVFPMHSVQTWMYETSTITDM